MGGASLAFKAISGFVVMPPDSMPEEIDAESLDGMPETAEDEMVGDITESLVLNEMADVTKTLVLDKMVVLDEMVGVVTETLGDTAGLVNKDKVPETANLAVDCEGLGL